MEQQQRFKFDDDKPPAHNIELNKERRQSLLELMGSIIIHVFNSQENQADEPPAPTNVS